MNSGSEIQKISFLGYLNIIHIIILTHYLIKKKKNQIYQRSGMLKGDSLILNDIVDQKAKNIDALNELQADEVLDRWDQLFVEGKKFEFKIKFKAQLLMYNGCFYEAARNFEALIAVDYKVDYCHHLCGQCDYMIDHFWHAYCHFNKSFTKSQEYMIECLFGMRKFDKAQELLSEIENITDRSLYLRSQCLFYQNKFYHSGQVIQQAIAMNPNPLYLNFQGTYNSQFFQQEKIYIQCIQLNFSTLNLDGQ